MIRIFTNSDSTETVQLTYRHLSIYTDLITTLKPSIV